MSNIVQIKRPLSAVLLIAASTTGLTFAKPALAEPEIVSNVTGDEIIIYADETFKPAVRDLGNSATGAEFAQKNKPIATKQVDSTLLYPKYNRGGRLGASLEINLATPAIDETTAFQATENMQDPGEDEAQIQHDDLWQRIKSGYAMPESTSPLTAKHELWYSSRPAYVERMVERSQRYLFHIVEEVEKRGMPTEIALLPMIESAYNPVANSKSNASGIWQFIPSTGKHFGLKQNWWVDNRRNITFATEAALTYLEKLYAMFGAWDLALAAYNAGEGTVGRAIERNQKRGLPTDYESLSLPDETRNYVPKLQAVKNLMTNPGKYGLEIQTIANTPYFAKVNAPAKLDTHLAAKLAEINHDELIALNPSFKRPVMTTENRELELLLPIMAAQTFKTNLANYDKPLVSWKSYQVKAGENIGKIADKFGITLAKLREVNQLSDKNKIKKTTTILVPSLPSDDAHSDNITIADNAPDWEPSTTKSVTHRVKKGDVLQTIANRYGVTVKQIMASNGLKSSRLKAGQLLTIHVERPVNIAEKPKNKVKGTHTKQTYIVKLGDTLHSIAEKFDVAVADLKRWNNKSDNRITPGTKLIIMPSGAA
ncbi:MAG: lytic transglycosylase [Betaproteobacteria bacterium HGW-Betaproteobacteria-22]|nr:MAG: lytic transglycosylase [Betaproteobacteria bacterium HGW-Betaproteobacteria-22]